MASVVADTHALLWMLRGTLRECSPSGADAIDQALIAKTLHAAPTKTSRERSASGWDLLEGWPSMAAGQGSRKTDARKLCVASQIGDFIHLQLEAP